MANITFDGFAYFEDNSISNSNIHYQAFFYPNGTASSPSSWNNVRIVESTGYYNVNVGDADWLGVTSVVLTGSKVLLVFWKGNTSNRNSLCSGNSRLEEWGVLEVDIDGSDVYSNNVQIRSNIPPNVNWSIPSLGYVGDSYTAINNSYDVHSWVFNGVTMHHYRTRYGEDIQLINTITESSYIWGDGTHTDTTGTVNASHTWSVAGTYNVQLSVTDECQSTTSGIKSIQIKNKTPIPNIICLEASGNIVSTPDTVVTFQYSGTDPNNAITGIDWTIYDTGLYGNTTTNSYNVPRDNIVNHVSGLGTSWCSHSATHGAFTNPGTHTVSIVIHWNDGFSDLVINYSEDFTQRLFSSPVSNFNQNPPQATLSGTVSFSNTSSNIDRVGKGLPDCTLYDWEYIDSGISKEHANNVGYAYTFSINPLSVNSKIKLCSNWNDGWENKVTCVTKDIVFDTKVIVNPEDCYYNLDIIGTSSDGTITGYSWEIYRDTTISGGSGPWEKIWQSPVGIDQKVKQIGFTEVGYYKVTGYIYGGGTTNDSEVLYIQEICPSSTIHVIWDGTGPLDTGSDWDREGFGFESTVSSHAGSNGLDASNISSGDSIVFNNHLSILDINDYESLNMWINIKHVVNNADVEISLHNIGFVQSRVLKLSDYININYINKWQKVFINLEDFGLRPLPIPGHPTYVNRLKLKATGNLSFYLDDVVFSVGRVEKTAITVCNTEMATTIVGGRRLRGDDMIPNMRGYVDKETNIRVINTFPKPKLT